MTKIEVIFQGTPDKHYSYVTKLPLEVGAMYKIIANGYTYSNPVTIVSKATITEEQIFGLREITGAKCLQNKYANAAKDYVDKLSKGSSSTRRPDDGIEKVIFNKEKRTCVVLWKDKTKTVLHCSEGDVWDEEKALALAYMKKYFDNRGCFNETLKKWCHVGREVDEQLHPHECTCKNSTAHVCNCKEKSVVSTSIENIEEYIKKEIVKNLTEMWGINYGG